MDIKLDPIIKEEVESLWYADSSGEELEINYKEYHQTEIRYKSLIRDIKVEREEVEHWPRKEGNCIKNGRNGCSDMRIGEKDEEDKHTDDKKEDVQVDEGDLEECGDEIKSLELANGKEYVRFHHYGEKRKIKELKEHIYSEHLTPSVDVQRGADSSEDVVNKYRCTFCHKEFKFNSQLLNHVRTHTGEKPFQCDLCEFRASTKSNLNVHFRRHTGETLYKCNICEYSSSVKGSLRKHMIQHTGEKPYTCNVCEYRSKQKGALRRHMLKHTGEKPHKCNVCDYRSSDKGTLKTHMLKHSGEKPHKCNVCEFRSAIKANLKTHMLKHNWKKPY